MRVRRLFKLLALCMIATMSVIGTSQHFTNIRHSTARVQVFKHHQRPDSRIRVSQTAPNASSVQEWKQWYPSWEREGLQRRVYDDETIGQVVKDVVPHLYNRFQSFARPIEKADYFRFAVLYRDGGVYADMDQELLDYALLLRLVNSSKVYLPLEKDVLIGQSLMISPPRHPFWLSIMEDLIKTYNPKCYVVDSFGPDAVVRFFLKSGGCATWGPRGVVIAENLIRRSSGRSRSGFLAHHHETHSWGGQADWFGGKGNWGNRRAKTYPCPPGRMQGGYCAQRV